MMEDILTLNKSNIIADRKAGTNSNMMEHSAEGKMNFPVVDYLIAEGGENFFHYLKRLGLVNEPNMMVFSSRNHYYYDYNDLKGVKTLINLKRLNLMKHLDSFLQTVCNALPPKSNFIGCFSDWRTQKKIELPSNRFKGFINYLDSRKEIEIDKNDVTGLLELHWFKVVDMTEINGVTYFRTENNGRLFE